MTHYPKYVVASLLVVCALPAWAGHNDRYIEPRYDYAKVVDARPIFETVQVPVERRVCHEQPVQRRVAWDVGWKYRGRIYHSRMDKPPGDRIRVRVNVNPVYP